MKRFNDLKYSFSEIWYILKPTSSHEQILFLSLLLYFAIIAILFCLIALPKEIPLGMLGYDTAGHLTYEPIKISSENVLNWNIRHPLYRMLFFPVITINEVLLNVGFNISWPLFLLTSTWMMSCSGLFIYKILLSFQLGNKEASLILLFFCSFAHVIMLSIQVDSFVMSMFFCSGMTLLFVRNFHNNLSDNLLFLGIAGTTSTNFIKFAFYQILEEKNLNITMIRFLKSLIVFSLLFIITIPNLVTRLIERPRGFLYAVIGDSFNFQGSDLNKWKLFIDNFLSDPLIFHHTTGIIFSHESILLPTYSTFWYYLPITFTFLLVLLSIIINWNKAIIHLFCCCFGFDIFMHFCIGYGMEEGQLFCGHWLFFVPIVIGVLIAKLPSIKKMIIVCLTLCTSFMLYLNLYHLFQSM